MGSIRGKTVVRVAKKLGYRVREGKKHIVVYDQNGIITILPRGKIRQGTLNGIIKDLGITKEEFNRLS
jgi:predicted RNA binding protein YcfA (HicA-like mRNA interferase family)